MDASQGPPRAEEWAEMREPAQEADLALELVTVEVTTEVIAEATGEVTVEEVIAGAMGETTAESVATLGFKAGESVFSGPWSVEL